MYILNRIKLMAPTYKYFTNIYLLLKILYRVLHSIIGNNIFEGQYHFENLQLLLNLRLQNYNQL